MEEMLCPNEEINRVQIKTGIYRKRIQEIPKGWQRETKLTQERKSTNNILSG